VITDLEVRKLQTTAAGTFIVTIPKEWAQRLSLNKGDLVNVELEDRDIVISPTTGKQSSQAHSLRVEDFKDQKLLELSITASYIQGHDITEIVAKGMMEPEQKRWIRKAVDGLIGVEIAEDYADKIILQNLIDPQKFQIDTLLQKFASTSNAVLLDGLRALARADLSLAQDAFERGEQSTKLYRLLMRLALQAARSRRIRDEMKIPDISSVVIKIIATRELGRMAYYSMRIAQHVAEVERKLDEQLVSLIQKMGKISAEMQDQALKALLSKDLAMASSIIDRMGQVRKLYEAAHPLITKQSDRSALSLSLIIRDVRAYAGFSVALADDAVLGVFDI
jgi:AbrB family looped-hinge helix DNA binding protein